MKKSQLVFDYIRLTLYRACCSFTFTCLFMYIFVNLFKTTDGSEKFVFNNEFFVFILLFSLIISLSSLIFKIKALPKVLAFAINFVVDALDFILVLQVWTGISTTAKQILFGTIGFTIIYILVMGLIALGKFLYKKIVSDKEYKEQFSDNNEGKRK